MEHGESFGQRVAQARRELAVQRREDVTPADLARALNVAPQTVYNWEGDRKNPPAETVARLAELLGVTPGWLLFGQEPKHPATPALPPVHHGQTVQQAIAERDADTKKPAKKAGGVKRGARR